MSFDMEKMLVVFLETRSVYKLLLASLKKVIPQFTGAPFFGLSYRKDLNGMVNSA